MLNMMNKSKREENLSQPLETVNKHFEIVVNFLTGYNCIFKDKNKNIKFCFIRSNNGDDFDVTIIPGGSYELLRLNEGSEGIFLKKALSQNKII